MAYFNGQAECPARWRTQPNAQRGKNPCPSEIKKQLTFVCFADFVFYFLQQKIGHRGQAALLGAVLTIPVGPLLLFTDMIPLVGTIWIGITFTVTAVRSHFRISFSLVIMERLIELYVHGCRTPKASLY